MSKFFFCAIISLCLVSFICVLYILWIIKKTFSNKIAASRSTQNDNDDDDDGGDGRIITVNTNIKVQSVYHGK